MKYKDPRTVQSPAKKITNVDVIYDGGGIHSGDTGFSIAIVTWGGQRTLAMRWNVSENEWYNQEKLNGVKECVGNPQSRGFATWFIIPTEIFDPESQITSEVIKKLGMLNMFKK